MTYKWEPDAHQRPSLFVLFRAIKTELNPRPVRRMARNVVRALYGPGAVLRRVLIPQTGCPARAGMF